jgi:hypothetical protein
LIDLYLLDCAKKRKKLAMKWVAQAVASEWSMRVIFGKK